VVCKQGKRIKILLEEGFAVVNIRVSNNFFLSPPKKWSTEKKAGHRQKKLIQEKA
jgi:hypothetical protein